MNDDWVTIYVIVVLSIAAIPIFLLIAWSIALCLLEIKQLQVARRHKYQENLRTIISGTTKVAGATTKTCQIEDITNETTGTSNTESFDVTTRKYEYF